MKINLAKGLALLAAIFASTHIGAVELGTEKNPYVLKCDTCYSITDFEKAAKRPPRANSADYFIVYNTKTAEFQTVYSYSLYETETRLSISEAITVATAPNQAVMMNGFFDWLLGQKEPSVFQISLPTYYDTPDVHYPAIRDALMEEHSTIIMLNQRFIVSVTFTNGVTAIFDVLQPNATNGGIKLIKLIETATNKDITPTGTGSSGGFFGGGTDGSSNSFTVPGNTLGGGTLMCSSSITRGGLRLTCKWV